MRFWLKMSGVVARRLFSEFANKGLDTWKHRQSAEENPHDKYNYPFNRQRQTAFSAEWSRTLCYGVMTVSGWHTVVCDCVCVGVLWSAVRSWRYMGLSLLSALSVGVSSCLLSVPCDWGCSQADRWRTVRAHCVCAMDSRSTIWQCSVHGTYWKCLKVSTHVVMVYGGSSASVLKGAIQIHYYYYRQACA